MATFDEVIHHIHSLPYDKRRLQIARTAHPQQTRFLYKYKTFDPDDDRSIERLHDIIVQSRLWLSSPVDFNDPFDMTAHVVATSTKLARRKRMMSLAKERGIGRQERKFLLRDLRKKPVGEFETELRNAYQQSLATFGVFSFAGDPRSILMWSHYAGDHTGVCLQLERAQDFLTLSSALPVEYSSNYPEVNWVTDFHESLGKVILRKHRGWAYEQEQRLMRPNNAHKYLQFGPDALVGVILGCRATAQHRGTIESLLNERAGLGMPSVRLYIALQHESEYRLVVVRESLANQPEKLSNLMSTRRVRHHIPCK
jgi:DNA-binding phage protein